MATAPDVTSRHVFDLWGDRLVLNFVNTAGGYRPERTNEHLHAYEDFLAFAEQAGAIAAEQARRLAAEARRRPREAAVALQELIALREGLYDLFLAVAQERPPPAAEVDRLNRALASALMHRRVVRRDGGFALGWEESAALDSPLWPMVADAAELLAEGNLARVKVCGAHEDAECSWLFLDRTKSGTRRWCSMRDCGNRAKARRHHERRKGER
jgi:predicted RNA-binding Zn ribbon-like protein